MAPAQGAAVQVESVWKSYDDTVAALRGISLDVAPGELLMVTGPSGSGKSTLLNVIGGLDVPDAGHVLVDGVDVANVADRAGFRRSTVGFVFQLHHLLPGLTARENVEVPLVPRRVSHAERTARARALLAEVGLAHREGHLPRALSGGERQRVAVARALVNEPRLLLADEPTGALDSHSGEQVMELIAQLRARHGMTVIVVSYDETVASRADRVLRLVDGQLTDGAYPSASAGGSRVTRHAG
jgi:ABC-type lipoprotein export system ATPase subunit